MVADWKFSSMKEDCFGDPANTSNKGWGGNYGKSAYMLFYERRKKKSLKIIVNEDDVEEDREKSSGRQVFYDDNKKEHYKMVPYSEGIDAEAPNKIYKSVNGDNAKLTFETDVYSPDFFQFLTDTLVSVNNLDDRESDLKINSLKMAKKVLFDILARCTLANQMKPIIETMCDLVVKDDKLAIDFLSEMFEDGNSLLELLLTNTQEQSQIQVAHLVKFMLAHCKLIEKDAIIANTIDCVSVTATCMNFLISHLTTTCVQSWARMTVYLEILYSFGVYSPE